jgi:hypothetical protein
MSALHEYVIPRPALVLFVFMMPRNSDRYSLDHVLRRA